MSVGGYEQCVCAPTCMCVCTGCEGVRTCVHACELICMWVCVRARVWMPVCGVFGWLCVWGVGVCPCVCL